VNITAEPSFLKFAECQNEKLSSMTSSMRCGSAGSEMSISSPLPMHAPAARPSSGYAVMSWQPLVLRFSCVPDGCMFGSLSRPLSAPVSSSRNSRASLTTSASSGASRGTSMTSIWYRPDSKIGSALGPVSTQPICVWIGEL
jgi:hypothetical protein